MLRAELHWERVVACYSERATNLATQMATIVATRPDTVAVIEGDLRLTYAQVDREAAAIAASLASRGVGAGDRVVVMLANGADVVRAILAILRLGAVLVAVGTRSRASELDFVCGDCEPVAIMHGPEFAEVVDGAPSVPGIRYDVSASDWRDAMAGDAASAQMPDLDEESPFAILYTSGTTGKPKGAVLTHLGAIHSCLHWCYAFGLGEDERTLVCVPWAHVSGLCGVVMPFLYLGGTLVMLPEFKRRAALELAERERITHALMVPAMYGLCLLEPDLADFDLGDWRIAAYGGAPMPEPTIARFAAAFPGLAMCNAYGATETSSAVTIMPPGEGTARADSIGRVVACGDIRVMDEAGREVPPGVDGELWIAGPMVVPGYWRNPAATDAAFSGGYWKSGDIGSVDAEGYVRIADRKKDMIIRGGFKVYPAEVESVLAGLDGVIEAAVVGRDDLMLGEAVVAFVTATHDAVTPARVRDWCAERLSDYKVPGEVIVETAPLPRNANGKIQKMELRVRAADPGAARGMTTILSRTPVLVGVGVATRREDDPANALEPIDLMIEAVRAAGADCGAPELLTELGSIAVPRGRWRYQNPSGEIARAVGATGATTIVSSVGVLQQTLIADACEAIAEGRIDSALVTGADAGYRILRSKIAGQRASERDQADEPDIRLEPKAELRDPAEVAAGLHMPVGLYAIIESARRAAAGLSIDAHRDRLAASWARFAAVAAGNPHAWDRRGLTAAAIREAGPHNPMQAFPYTRAHCSTWNVDQAAALLLCSAERAAALGINRSRWVFPVASAESNHMLSVSARADLIRSPGADATATAVFAASGIGPADVDLVDLYSCFPVAVDVYADAAGLDHDRDLTITGGMAFAGGPYNNYFFQATARAAELLRAGAGRTALLSCVSGILTKQAFALWSTEPSPAGFVRRDVTVEVAAATAALPVVENYTGGGTIAGCTVLHARGETPRAVALIDTEDGARALAVSQDEGTVTSMEREEWVGRSVRVVDGQLAA